MTFLLPPGIKRLNVLFRKFPFKGGGIGLTKNLKKGGMEKLLKGRGILRRGDSVGKGDAVGKGGMLLVWVFFLARVWQMY